MSTKLLANTDAERPGSGRPTRAQQTQRQEELLNVALDVFLEMGFERTTMEEIAAQVGMSKRTIYARYEDKAALFKASVRRAVERFTMPRETLEAVVTDNLEQTLAAIARLRIVNSATPIAIKLQRILSAQSYRFPELFTIAIDEGTGPTLDLLCSLFERHSASGEIHVTEPRRAATAFLSLAVSGSARLVVAGKTLDKAEVEKRISFGVGLFLNGVRR
ncbi:MAG: transcriptional regulator, TetR family [Hydrocarboniphaga sp.]|uniref:TetR/AcrR family transcriptional regulator n=1 Tax=Hydrocarboniphaga sp. TaxID=2033016 RepID=UPI002606B33D|nr:TetR/AcrR family transcriptional regulator [Hydrocarboniphaga sp.]MDB5972228.1 transcriptional regulator, TetR family [Hydrocarboniphaga sp.]